MSPGPVRVLVVDNSPFARKVLREVLSQAQGVEVVGVAVDGPDALEQIASLSPDVVVLDLLMPGMSGIEVLKALPAGNTPAVVIVTIVDEDSELGDQARAAGAAGWVKKTTGLATDRLYDLRDDLVRAVLRAASRRARATPASPASSSPASQASQASSAHRPRGARRMLVIGASTGGPQALTRLITALPGNLEAPVALALHIALGYTEGFANRLDAQSALTVIEAYDGLELRPGLVAVARAGMHLKIRRRGELAFASLDLLPIDKPHHPSVDVLFSTAAEAFGPDVVAVVLTGMGDDGLIGARAIRAAGGTVLVEAESSCVVYGMPRVVMEAGLAHAEAPIGEMASLVLRALG